ncbi:MAG: DUF6056 family protein [Gallionellaceae bacterium]
MVYPQLARFNFPLFFIAIFSICLGVLGYFSWPSIDDYCNFLNYSDVELLPHMFALYFGWTGRILTSLIVGLEVKLSSIQNVNLLNGVAGFELVLLAYLVASIVFHNTPQRVRWMTVAVLPVLWFTLRPIIGETVFWFTGGVVYLFPMLLGGFWMLQLMSILNGNNSKLISNLPLSVLFIWGCIVGNGIELLSPALVFFGLALLTKRWGALQSKEKNMAVAMLLGVFVGALVVILAPGNFVRATYHPNSFNFNLDSVLHGIAVLYSVFIYKLNWPIYIFPSIAILVLLLAAKAYTKSKQPSDFLGYLMQLPHKFAWPILYFVCAVVTVLPLIPVSSFAEPRTGFYFTVFSVMGVFSILNILLEDAVIQKSSKSRWAMFQIVSIIFAGITVFSIVSDITLAIQIKKQFKQRDSYISKTASTDRIIRVPSIVGEAPKSLFLFDISTDVDLWTNTCVARYYKKDKVGIQ